MLAPDGYAIAKWLVYNSGLDLRGLKYRVHSANPVAKVQIKSLLDNYIQHLGTTSPFKVSAHLDSPEMVRAYLEEVLLEKEDALLLSALDDIEDCRVDTIGKKGGQH